jgi:hypothetical protein
MCAFLIGASYVDANPDYTIEGPDQPGIFYLTWDGDPDKLEMWGNATDVLGVEEDLRLGYDISPGTPQNGWFYYTSDGNLGETNLFHIGQGMYTWTGEVDNREGDWIQSPGNGMGGYIADHGIFCTHMGEWDEEHYFSMQ